MLGWVAHKQCMIGNIFCHNTASIDDVLADVAVLADLRAGEGMREVPDFGALADGHVIIDISGHRLGASFCFLPNFYFSLFTFRFPLLLLFPLLFFRISFCRTDTEDHHLAVPRTGTSSRSFWPDCLPSVRGRGHPS